MNFSGFNDNDFDVFQVPGLEPRMELLIEFPQRYVGSLGIFLTWIIH